MGFLGVLFFVVATALPYLFPVFTLPEPAGPHKVGTVSYHFTDSSRSEVYTSDSADYRELMVQFWYPADPAAGARTGLYKPDADVEGIAMANAFGGPSFIFDHLKLIRSHSFAEAPVSKKQQSYPVIVFSHGHAYFATRTQNTILAEDLASHGYIVVGIDHTYESTATVFPDGRIVWVDTGLVASRRRTRKKGPVRDSLLNVLALSKNPLERSNAANQLREFNGLFEESIPVWSADARFVLNRIELLNTNALTPFAGKIHPTKVGIVGMSFGGANAAQTSRLDSRFKAGINMDGFQYGDVVEAGLDQPFMFMYSESNADMNNFAYGQFRNTVYTVKIRGSNHSNFSELSLIAPVLNQLFAGSKIDSRRCLKIINSYVLAFFERHLNVRNAQLLDGPSIEYPEVVIETRKSNDVR
ncbi:MAG TPA: hypothetical protein VES88_17935 [Gemmatimonadaceae bacterium]|nr:hypothetical protein [Gemmatimonadaceae bacterium]